MKRLSGIFFILFLAFHSFAQSNLFVKLTAAIALQTGKQPDNKLIAVNVWSAENRSSRNLNAEFDKAAKVYEYAKLKGGLYGIIGVSFSLDQDQVNVDVTLKKDGITKLISFSVKDAGLAQILGSKPAGYNIVFDRDGAVVYEDLKEGTVFSSINQLITR